MLAKNLRDEQRKMVGFGHFPANLVIFMIVYDQPRILRDLVREGYRVTSNILPPLSPYRSAHVNRFGNYHSSIKRETPQLGYGDDFMAPSDPVSQPYEALLQENERMVAIPQTNPVQVITATFK